MVTIIIKFIIFIAFMFCAAFFSAAETAVTSLTNSSIRRIKEKYNKLYKYFLYWEKKQEEIISTMIVWMNLSVVAIGVATTSLELDIINLFNLNKSIWIGLFPAISIVITLIFANLLPKTFSRYKADIVAITTLPIIVKNQ